MKAVTLTVQIFGIVSLMGKQFVDIQSKLMVIDCYLPILPAMLVLVIFYILFFNFFFKIAVTNIYTLQYTNNHISFRYYV